MDEQDLLKQLRATWERETLEDFASQLEERLSFEHQRGDEREDEWDEGYDEAMSNARDELANLLKAFLAEGVR